MERTHVVAGSLVPLPVGADPLVVEAEPQSDLTSCFKNVARYVFRLVQGMRWADDPDSAITVGVAGSHPAAPLVAPNVGVLLAPLLDVAIVGGPASPEPWEVLGGDRPPAGADLTGDPTTVLPTPRDRVWLAPGEGWRADPILGAFELAIGQVEGDGPARLDLALVVAPAGDGGVRPPPIAHRAREIAVVLADASSVDHPDTVPILD